MVAPDSYRAKTDGSLGDGPWRCRSDADGFLITGNETAADAAPIVFLGDSFVESMYNPESVRFVSVAERALNAQGWNVRCLNGGYSGSTTLQLFNVLMNKVVPLVGRGGTVVFFVPVGSDIPIYFRPHSYWYPTDRYAPILPPFTPAGSDIPNGGSALESLLRLVVAAARELELNLILVSSPHRHSERGDDPYLDRLLSDEQDRSLKQRHAVIHAATQRAASETGVHFLDGTVAFLEHPDAFYDEVHLNDAGQGAFAEWLLVRLRTILLELADGLSDESIPIQRPN